MGTVGGAGVRGSSSDVAGPSSDGTWPELCDGVTRTRRNGCPEMYAAAAAVSKKWLIRISIVNVSLNCDRPMLIGAACCPLGSVRFHPAAGIGSRLTAPDGIPRPTSVAWIDAKVVASAVKTYTWFAWYTLDAPSPKTASRCMLSVSPRLPNGCVHAFLTGLYVLTT